MADSTTTGGTGETQQPQIGPLEGSGTVFNPNIKTTGPTTLRRHLLSDEQLDMFTLEKREGLAEAFWAFVAGALAAIPSAGESLYNAYIADPPIPLTLLHLFEVAIVLVCAALAIAIKIVWKGRSKRIEQMVADIKNRPAQ